MQTVVSTVSSDSIMQTVVRTVSSDSIMQTVVSTVSSDSIMQTVVSTVLSDKQRSVYRPRSKQVLHCVQRLLYDAVSE
jgi:hypothetical protein